MTLAPYGMGSYRTSRSLSARVLRTAACGLASVLFGFSTAVAEVVITGVDTDLETNVRNLMPLAVTGCDSAQWRVERLFRDADIEIGKALQALGYYEPSISKSLSWSADCWQADFDINAGGPVRVRATDIAVLGGANDDPIFQARAQAAAPVTGDILNHGSYESYKSSLLKAAINAGYFDAEFLRSSVIVDREAKAADIDLQLKSGVKYKFGAVSFTEGILRQKMLYGYTNITAGNPYSAKAIGELYEALNGSGYFASVSISTEPLNTVDKIAPVTISLTPANRYVYSAGVGFSTDTGPHGRLGYTDRRINDKGHQFESKLFASRVQSDVNATYRWPRNDPRREWYSVVAGARFEKTDTSESDTYKIGLLRSRSLGALWLETRYIDFERENFVVADQDASSQLIILGTNWEKATGRALSRTDHGYRLSFDVRGASDSLGSDTSFLQLRTKAKWIRSLGAKTRILAQTNLGLTHKDELSELPASVRFFAGGDRSVRGYAFESIGPENADGDVIGGSHLIDASLEIDYLFKNQWALAAFVDTGSAFDTTEIDFKSGVGVGVRWYSPVGPIRFDLAHPLDNPDESIRIHISLGPDL